MSNGKAIVLGVPVLVLAAVAGHDLSGTKLTGNALEATFSYYTYSPDQNVWASISVVDSSDGKKMYSVYWQTCIYNPDYDHRLCAWASGLVPLSLIPTQKTESMTLDLDVPMLSDGGAWGEDCTTGTCVPFTPVSLPLKGVITAYSGPGSSYERTAGTTQQESIYPFGGHQSTTFSGERTNYSANFVGTVGTIAVSAPEIGANGNFVLSKGVRKWEQVYPPTP